MLIMKTKMVNVSEIGDIKAVRKERGLSQCKVAKYCGVSIQALYRWEQGLTKQISKDRYDKLCEILDVKVC